MPLKSPLLESIPHLRHGFGDRLEPVAGFFKPYWDGRNPHWRQVHGDRICEVAAADQECGETDSMVTFERNVPIGVVTADCVPILLARRTLRDGQPGLAAIHAGWRGTQARLPEKMLAYLKSRGEDLKDWVAAIGPAIGPCCYEVSEDLAQEFLATFRELPAALVAPSPRILDLPSINEALLKKSGLGAVEKLAVCTRCSQKGTDFVYESFRRDAGKARQWSTLIAL